MVVFCFSYAADCTFKYMVSYCFKYKTHHRYGETRSNFRNSIYPLCHMAIVCFLLESIYCNQQLNKTADN